MELDIETISVPTLWKIYELITEYSPETEADLRASYAPKGSPEEFARPAPKKKNKPMSKHEQERKIQALQQSVQQFEQRQSSGSQEPVMQSKLSPTKSHFQQTNPHAAVEQDESSGDEESDDSEEE
jgi:bromodomain-containing factor 1